MLERFFKQKDEEEKRSWVERNITSKYDVRELAETSLVYQIMRKKFLNEEQKGLFNDWKKLKKGEMDDLQVQRYAIHGVWVRIRKSDMDDDEKLNILNEASSRIPEIFEDIEKS